MLELITTFLICLTAFLIVLRITGKGIPITIIRNEVRTAQIEEVPDSPEVDKNTLDAVLSEIYDAFDINVVTKEDKDNG